MVEVQAHHSKVIRTAEVQARRFKPIPTGNLVLMAAVRAPVFKPVRAAARDRNLEQGFQIFSNSNNTSSRATIHNQVSIRLDLPRQVAEELNLQRRER